MGDASAMFVYKAKAVRETVGREGLGKVVVGGGFWAEGWAVLRVRLRAYGCVTGWAEQRLPGAAVLRGDGLGRGGMGETLETYQQAEAHGRGVRDIACRWLGVGLGLQLWGALDGREAYSDAGCIDVGEGQRWASEQYDLRSERLFCCHQGPTKHEIHHKAGNLSGTEGRGFVLPGASVQARSQGACVYKHQLAGGEEGRAGAKGGVVLEAAGVEPVSA